MDMVILQAKTVSHQLYWGKQGYEAVHRMMLPICGDKIIGQNYDAD